MAGEIIPTEFEASLTDRQRELIERLADWIVREADGNFDVAQFTQRLDATLQRAGR